MRVPVNSTNLLMLPLWLKYPEILPGSIGWRMGDGEDYWFEWHDWFRAQDRDFRAAYVARYPEPTGWERLYECTTRGLE